jgi:thioredoxin reductase
MRRLGVADLSRYDTVSLERVEVTDAVALDDGGFRVTLADARTLTCAKLLLATGVVDRVPDVPGFAEMYGRTVFHCPYCDGWEFRGLSIAVYGKARHGYGLALELLGWTHDVVLCTDGPSDLDAADRDRLARNAIELREERVARLVGRDGVLDGIVFTDGSVLRRRALFFNNGQLQCSGLAERLGCVLNEKGTVRTGPYESTRIPGLYVAGDASRSVQWVVVAAAEGAEAAYAINQDLLKSSRR